MRIGIITCRNMTDDMGCSSLMCLDESRAGKGEFARYAECGGAQIAGIISCAGCPTVLAPEKILRRVRTLVASGVEAIHFGNCMEKLCPFKKKYESILRTEFPHIQFVHGTHEMGTDDQEEALLHFVGEGLRQQPVSMADLIINLGKAGKDDPGR